MQSPAPAGAFPPLDDDEVRALGEGGVIVRDQVVPAEQVARWASVLDGLDEGRHLSPAGVGKRSQRDGTLRGDRTSWLDDVGPERMPGLRDVFEQVRVELNRSAWLGLRAFEVQLAVYPGDGARYVAHRDAFAGDPARRATVILYLNPSWHPDHGGCLRVSLPDGPREVEPIGGRLVVFLADRVEHEVLPTSAVRRAATAWYRGDDGV